MSRNAFIVCGGRHFSDYAALAYALAVFCQARPHLQCLVHGAASGADTLAEMWAIARSTPYWPFPADWNRYGRAAGPMRNTAMLAEAKPTWAVAFPGGRGTQNTIDQARRQGVSVLAPVL